MTFLFQCPAWRNIKYLNSKSHYNRNKKTAIQGKTFIQKSVWYNNSLKKDNVTWLSWNTCFHYAAMQFEIGKYWPMSPSCSLFKLRRYSLISGLPAYSCLERSRCYTIPGIATNFLPRGILISTHICSNATLPCT